MNGKEEGKEKFREGCEPQNTQLRAKCKIAPVCGLSDCGLDCFGTSAKFMPRLALAGGQFFWADSADPDAEVL